ncbi:hypothetical protein QBC42DRAFT_282041 [Cladorrhinum samala]|uniref:Uncharacterized protein n=1 Tax=Cladorrhinum samala TaxID=585594 RepID=A0AAV9I0B4_9PEZI|nr:hypothetical protein QBC42DRAFT_282041 [Cladorrhinum samala]
MAYRTTKVHQRYIDDEDEGTCGCFGKSKSKSQPSRPYPPMARPQQIPFNTQSKKAPYYNATIPHSRSDGRKTGSHKPTPSPPALAPTAGHRTTAAQIKETHYNPSIKPSREIGAAAGMPRRQAAYREPPTPYPGGYRQQVGPSPAPALPSVFNPFSPEHEAAATTTVAAKITKVKPPPLAMNNMLKYQSPYVLTRDELKAGISPQSIIGRPRWSKAPTVSPV